MNGPHWPCELVAEKRLVLTLSLLPLSLFETYLQRFGFKVGLTNSLWAKPIKRCFSIATEAPTLLNEKHGSPTWSPAYSHALLSVKTATWLRVQVAGPGCMGFVRCWTIYQSWVTLDTLLNLSASRASPIKRGQLILHGLWRYYKDGIEGNKKGSAYPLTHWCSRKVWLLGCPAPCLWFYISNTFAFCSFLDHRFINCLRICLSKVNLSRFTWHFLAFS